MKTPLSKRLRSASKVRVTYFDFILVAGEEVMELNKVYLHVLNYHASR